MESNEAIVACYSSECKFNMKLTSEPTCQFKLVYIKGGVCANYQRREY